MDQPAPQTPTVDITKQAYRGPSVAVVSLGQGFIDHFKWGLMGLTIAGVIGGIFHKPMKAIIDPVRVALQKGEQKPDLWIKIPSNLASKLTGRGPLSERTVQAMQSLPKIDFDKQKHWLSQQEHGFGLWFLNHTVGLVLDLFTKFIFKDALANGVKNRDWAKMAVTIGGLGGITGYAYGWGHALIYGRGAAHTGRHQFESAQEEVRDQRLLNHDLREKYVETQLALDEIKTIQAAERGNLRVSSDEPPALPKPQNEKTPTPDAIRQPNVDQAPESPTKRIATNTADWKEKISQKADTREIELA